ncbi:MAG: caspase family protein, partial [Acidobacteriota bacterium]|nr:caspase family protein [Acidobacteriota bacterium]
KLKAGGNGLFYYAGHGVQSKGHNYIIPVDAEIQSEADVEDSGVDVGLVLNYMDDAQNGLNIVILDACRNNPFARSFRSASDGLAQVDAPTGTLIAYATAPGRVAADGVGANGLYTSELLKAMRLPGLTATDMFMRVRAEVMKQTGSKQVPWEASSLVGSFYFGGGPTDSASTTATTTSRIDPTAFELSYWDTIKNSQNADDFQAYLQRYPQGQFVELARNRITSLQAGTKAAGMSVPATRGSQTELTFWDSIKNSTNADDFRAYLKKYPEGEFIELANNRLRSLEKPAEPAKPVENFKSWKGTFGVKSATLGFEWHGALKVGATSVVFDCEGNDKYCKADEERKFSCAELAKIVVEKNFIREIAIKQFKYRFTFNTATDANSAFAAIKQACNPSQ